jgi:hypothetical protein
MPNELARNVNALKELGVFKVGAHGHPQLTKMVTIEPGTRAVDILGSLGMMDFDVINPATGAPFALHDVVYGPLEDGGKILLVPRMDFGIEQIRPKRIRSLPYSQVARLLDSLHGGKPKSPPTHITPLPDRRIGPPPYWREENWKQVATDEYEGYFTTAYGSWKGRIIFRDGTARVEILNPPMIPRSYEHRYCLMDCRDAGWWYLHFRQAPTSVDAGIIGMQTYLLEALSADN